MILDNAEASTVIEIFNENIKAMDIEITALETIKSALKIFIAKIEELAAVRLDANLLTDMSVMELVQSLSLTQKNVKEYQMENLNQAAEVLNQRHNVKLRVELAFNGNCAEAIALYEKAFGIKAEHILRYKDVPAEEAYPEGTQDYVMHTWLKLGNDEIGTIGMHDRMPDNKCNYGDGVAVHVSLESANAIQSAFDVLKDGGKISTAPDAVFFSECYCEVTDKFGVSWILMFN